MLLAKAKKFLRNNVFSVRDDALRMAKRKNTRDARIIKLRRQLGIVRFDVDR